MISSHARRLVVPAWLTGQFCWVGLAKLLGFQWGLPKGAARRGISSEREWVSGSRLCHYGNKVNEPFL